MNSKPHVAVVGATGAVGVEMIKTLERRNFQAATLTLLASARSLGKKLRFHGDEIAIEELERQVGQIVAGRPVTKEVYPHQIAFNVLPHVDSFLPSGYTKEEMKMENEGRKIMHHPTFRASVTCVRVPVYRAHSVAVSAEFAKPVTVESARAVLSNAPGLDLVDDAEKREYPMPLYTAEKYNCQVGRIRQDCALDNGLCFWVSGDQLLKGAALNAVQIAEELVK